MDYSKFIENLLYDDDGQTKPFIPQVIRRDGNGNEIPEQKVFEVTDLGVADWTVHRILRLQSQANEIRELAKRRKAELDARVEAITNALENEIEFFTGPLRAWAEESLKNEKKRSIKLLSGTVGLRKTPERTEIEDEDALIAWLKQTNHTEAIKTKETILKTELKKIEGKIPFVQTYPSVDRLEIKET